MDKKLVDRINELARKAKSPGGLTEAESSERAELRRQYMQLIRCDLERQIECITIVDKDGNARPVKKRTAGPSEPLPPEVN